MKNYLLLLVFCLSCFVAISEEISEDEMERLQRSVRIGSVYDDTIDGDDDLEYVQLRFYTYQNQDDAEKYTFRVKVVVELTDKKTSTITYSQFAREQGSVDSEYTGEDNWQFLVAQGDLKRPKVTAYVVQYGIMVDKEFKILAEETDDVDTIDELIKRTPDRMEQKPKMLHQYSYVDSDGAVQTTQFE